MISLPLRFILGELPPACQLEHPEDIILIMHSAVQTDEGNKAAQFFGFEAAFTSVEDSVDGIVAKVCSVLSLTPFTRRSQGLIKFDRSMPLHVRIPLVDSSPSTTPLLFGRVWDKGKCSK